MMEFSSEVDRTRRRRAKATECLKTNNKGVWNEGRVQERGAKTHPCTVEAGLVGR